MSSPSGILEKMLPNNVNSGYPVGCATPSLIQTAASSPVSINDRVGARVVRYTENGTKKEIS